MNTGAEANDTGTPVARAEVLLMEANVTLRAQIPLILLYLGPWTLRVRFQEFGGPLCGESYDKDKRHGNSATGFRIFKHMRYKSVGSGCKA